MATSKDEAPAINAATRKKLITLVTTGRDLLEKAEAILQEIDTLCAGGASIGEQLKALQQAWNTAWSTRHGGVYLFTFAKDVPAMKRLLKAFALDDLQVRMVAYMKDEDPFYVRAKHPFGVFAANVNRWVSGQGASALVLPPVGCAHTPACRSDQEHTQKRQAEMRA